MFIKINLIITLTILLKRTARLAIAQIIMQTIFVLLNTVLNPEMYACAIKDANRVHPIILGKSNHLQIKDANVTINLSTSLFCEFFFKL